MATNVIHHIPSTLALGAERTSALGYKPNATLDTTILGGIGIVDKYGKLKGTPRMFSEQLTTAWSQLLDVLAERGISTPDRFLTPSLLPGNSIDKDGMTVKMWVLELGRLASWVKLTRESDGATYFRCLRDKKADTKIYRGTEIPNILMLGYRTVLPQYESTAYNMEDKSITIRANEVSYYFFKDDAIKDLTAEQFYDKMKNQYLIYELAEPIYIPFDNPLNLNFAGMEYTDIPVMFDMEGNQMSDVVAVEVGYDAETGTLYRVKASAEDEELAGITYVSEMPSGTTQMLNTRIAPNKEWIQAHGQIPVGAWMTLLGLGRTYNAHWAKLLEDRVAALESKNL